MSRRSRSTGSVVLQNTGNDTRPGRVRLTPGPHPIVVEHAQLDARYRMELLWARENAWGVGWFGRDVERSLSPVPAWALWTVPPSLWRMQAARIVDPIPIAGARRRSLRLALWTVWQRKWLSRIALPRPDWALLLILAFGAYFRLQYIELPMAEKHSWRQITNADIARNFSERRSTSCIPASAGAAPASRTSGWSFRSCSGRARCSFAWLGVRDVICRAIAVALLPGDDRRTVRDWDAVCGTARLGAAPRFSTRFLRRRFFRAHVPVGHADGLLFRFRRLGLCVVPENRQAQRARVGHGDGGAGVHGEDSGGHHPRAHRVSRVAGERLGGRARSLLFSGAWPSSSC